MTPFEFFILALILNLSSESNERYTISWKYISTFNGDVISM